MRVFTIILCLLLLCGCGVDNKNENTTTQVEQDRRLTPREQREEHDRKVRNHEIVFVENFSDSYHYYKTCVWIEDQNALREMSIDIAKESGRTLCPFCKGEN